MATINKIVWLDIPVSNLERATNFYHHLMELNFLIQEHHGIKFALCPHQGDEAAFCLVFDPLHQVDDGLQQSYPLIYLNVNGRLDEAVKEVQKHGGKILVNKEQIGPYGFRAVILDSEGNKIALHSS